MPFGISLSGGFASRPDLRENEIEIRGCAVSRAARSREENGVS